MVDNKLISFDLSNPDSRENANFAATLASLSYMTQSEIEVGLKNHGYMGTDVIFIKHHLLSCFILKWGDITAIAFKGSKTWREWLNNFNVWPQATNSGRIHAGFLYTIQCIGPTIYRLIYADIILGKRIVLTGHSRGGAIALLFVDLLARNGHYAHSVWNFGSPKVGDGEFAALWKEKVLVKAFVNGPDPVVDFPPNISTNIAIIKWLMQFRVIFIPVTLVYYSVIILRKYFLGLQAAGWPIRKLLMRHIRIAFVRKK
ncbi:MAG: Lipase family protein [Candidatus Gallionella acididurans]|uniref:Lipase family protein n=1 Tax=Candidatus Gallionella acididurans TaxID=1796491 RepID=A0A139BRS5_9PROT|nr:MAG: Lipase family protein [Candidatus Gallionella acididurans]